LLFSAVLLWGRAATTASDGLHRIWKGNFTSPAPTSKALRIVDWNIDRGKNLDKVAAELERERPDICVLQEVDLFTDRSGNRNIAEQLARRLKLNYVFAPGFQELGQGSAEKSAFQGQAILTRLPIDAVRVIRFRTQSPFWKPRAFLPRWPFLQRRLGGRIALVAELKYAGETLVLYNTHLESRSFGRIQTHQLNEILADAKEHYSAETSIVLAGDFNTKYNPGAFAARLRRAGWTSAFGNRTPRTHRFICSLDWLLVRGPLDVRQGKVVHGVGASDHFPIFAVVSTSASSTALSVLPPK
jgi:endonuclease/exonuclease/phosphatase family metal-dependent hydrolase